MATIIPFPSKDKKTREELQNELNDMIIDVSLDLTMGVFSRLESTFPDTDLFIDKDMQKSMILIHEAIKGAVARAYKQEHFLQQFAEEVIKFENADIKFEVDGEPEELEPELP